MDNVYSMHSQALLGIFITVGLFLIILFLRQRNSGIQQPHRLYLKKESAKNLPNQRNAPEVRPEVISKEALEEGKIGAKEKNLNVLFMFNGHSFDAHEVLGIPAGASRKMIEEAYVMAQAKAGGQKEFVEAAYQALIISVKK